MAADPPAIETSALSLVASAAGLTLHAIDPLQTGIDDTGTLVVLLAGLLALVSGSLLVERRDLQTP